MAGLGGFGCGLTIGFGRFVGWGSCCSLGEFQPVETFFLESAWYCCFCVWVGEGDVGRLFMHGTIWVDLCYFAKRASSVLCITEIYSRNDKSSTKSPSWRAAVRFKLAAHQRSSSVSSVSLPSPSPTGAAWPPLMTANLHQASKA